MASSSRQKSGSSGSTRPAAPHAGGSNNPRLKASRAARAGAAPRAAAPRRSGAAPQRRSAAGNASARGRGKAASVTSVRIGDIDRLERAAQRKQAARASRKPLIIGGVIVGLVVAAVIALFVLSRTSAFQIENVEFVGADHLTTEEVNQLVSIPQGTTLINVDVDAVKASLERDAWVQSVTVNRQFPSTLQVVITERDIAAVVDVPVGEAQTIQSWAVSSDGMWLMAIPAQDSDIGRTISPKIYEDAAAVLHITDVPYGVTPEIGAWCTDENVNNALSIVDGMTTDLAGRVKAVSATDAESTLLTLDNGIEIAFGTADNIRDKERVCLEIMEQHPSVVYINVRVVDRPTWRAA